jgi:hypothetical protein
MATMRNEGMYKTAFALKDRLGKELEGYLNSDRRKKFGKGLFRHYPELVSTVFYPPCNSLIDCGARMPTEDQETT